MNTASQYVSPGLHRLFAAVGLVCFMYAFSYWLVGHGSSSRYNPDGALVNTVLAPVALGPLFLIWQWIRIRRPEAAVLLLNAYGVGWLFLWIVATYTRLGLGLIPLFIVASLVVFLYATILFSQELRSRRFALIPLLASIITLFASGEVLVNFTLVPIVI